MSSGLDHNKKTDWNSYYDQPFKSATVTRKITTWHLIRLIEQYSERKSVAIAELGGANSCFADAILAKKFVDRFEVFDNNQLGLKKLAARVRDPRLNHFEIDLTQDLNPQSKYDIVFSVGLIEHFDQKTTAQVIQNHFLLCKPEGFVFIFFPTPTILYRATRAIAELSGQWIFHDERPLSFEEVIASCNSAELIEKFINWPIFLTQGVLVFRKID